MATVKEHLHDLAESLPDDATFDDLIEQVYVREKIEAAIRAGEAGRVVSHEAVRRRFSDR